MLDDPMWRAPALIGRVEILCHNRPYMSSPSAICDYTRGSEATTELVELCHIDKDKYVETLSLPKNLLEYFGYGIYVGRK